MRKVSHGLRCGCAMAMLAGASIASTAHAQSTPALGYDVVSIKPDKTGPGMMSVSMNKSQYMATNVSLRSMLESAYGLKTDDQLTGLPGWAETAAFDVEAKADPETATAIDKLPKEERNKVQLQMLQAMLADRFQLKVHHETKVLSLYSLVIAKGGLKMKEADPKDTYANGIKGPDGASHGGMFSVSNGKMTGQGVGISNLVMNLSRMVQRQVDDKTGLTGKYDFTLSFTPEGMPAESKEATGVDTAPSIFTALQEELGLRLEATKGPVDTIVVDHVEMPSAN
jgi:uncharacterized protein (TIGR03435 family)